MSIESSLSLFAMVAIAVPMLGSLLIVMLPRPYAKWICAFAGGIATVASVGLAATFAGNGMNAVDVTWASMGQTLVMGFIFDRMSTLLAPAFVAIGLLVVIYSFPYMSDKNKEHPDAPRRRFYVYFSTFIGAMAGLAYSSTIVGQLVFFEITGVCSWGLISYYMTPTAKKAGMKALIITHIGALGLYIGAAFLFAGTGTFALSAISQLDSGMKTVVLLLILFAAWAKSAQFPLYMWLPSAMEAPTPVSAYLHGASMVKVGVCVFARALASAGDIPEIVGWVAIIDAVVTMLFGFLMYLPQKDMKRLLAFSTIAQLAYVFFGLGLSVFGSQMAFNGAVEHIFHQDPVLPHRWLSQLHAGNPYAAQDPGPHEEVPGHGRGLCGRRDRYRRRAPHEHVLFQVPDHFRWLRGWCYQHGHLCPRVRHGRRDRRHLRMVPALDG